MNILELVENVREGRSVRQSQEKLYSSVRETLLERLERKLSPRLRARLDAEDVLHEAFIRGMGALDLFAPKTEAAFHAWIYTIAKNIILDQAKRTSLGALHFARGAEEKGPRASAVQARQRRVESLLQGRERLEGLLRRLRDREAQVIRLRKVDGLSFRQIGEILGKSAEAAKQSYARAWRKLRRLSEETEG